MQLYQLLFPNGKKYIGITSKTAKERFKRHCSIHSRCKALSRAIKKYGKESIIISVLAECDNWELLCLAEIEAIEKFNTISPNGYNLTSGGEGFAGLAKTEDHKKKIGLANKGKKLSISQIEWLRECNKGNKHRIGKYNTQETKDKISKSLTGKKQSIDQRNRTSIRMIGNNHNVGRKHSKESRDNMAMSKIGHITSIETRKKISESNKGKIVSVDTRKKMSIAKTGLKSSDETKKKLSEIKKGKVCGRNKMTLDRLNRINNVYDFYRLNGTKGITDFCLSNKTTRNTFYNDLKHIAETGIEEINNSYAFGAEELEIRFSQ